MSEKIKVEIFRDLMASSNIDVSVAHDGLSIITDAINDDPFEIIGDTRKFRFASQTDSINIDTFYWANLKADMAIILTDRALQRNNNFEVFGFAKRLPEVKELGGIAVTNTTFLQPDLTVAHETGHLLALNYGYTLNPRTSQPHCLNSRCIMHETNQNETITEAVPRSGVLGFLERSGYFPPKYERHEQLVAQKFCPPCEEQLAEKTSYAYTAIKK